MRTDWPKHVQELAEFVIADIPRIRVILDELGIPNVDYEDPEDFLPRAILSADEAHSLIPFQAMLLRASLMRAGADIAAEVNKRYAVPQSMASQTFLSQDALVAAKRLVQACEVVCIVEIDGDDDIDRSHGTGVLVSPMLVLTAAHVVQRLVERAGDGWRAKEGSSHRIQVIFGHAADLVDGNTIKPPGARRVTPLAAQWLVDFSPPGPKEVAGPEFVLDSVEGIGSEGPWDLALLRLEKPHKSAPLSPRARIPRQPFQVHVLHHPEDGRGRALPLQSSIGRVDERLGDPPLRVLHSASTARGSSGAPVVDADFHLVGLHQAGSLQPTEDMACNRAVPAPRWRAMVAAASIPEAVPYLHTVDVSQNDGTIVRTHVVGRRETQARVWRSVALTSDPADRLVTVIGTSETGVRFTKHIVRGMVTTVGGIFASIDVVNSHGDDAAAFAARVTGAFAASLPRARATGLTTAQRDLRNRTVPALIGKLERAAGKSGAWLVLEGFDSSTGGPSAVVMDVVGQLIRGLPQMPHVRLVLSGWQESLPPGFEPSVEYLVAPTWEDIARTLVPPGRDSDEQLIQELKPFVEPAYRRASEAEAGVDAYGAAERARAALAPAVAVLLAARGIGAGSV
ncbi:hypothetical protein GCM10009573_28670 [Agromyces bracchium]